MFALTQTFHSNVRRFGGTVHIPKDCRETIKKVFCSAISLSPYDFSNIGEVEQRAGDVLRSHLPHNVLQAISEVRHGERGYLEITGNPQDDETPPTPLQEGVFEKQKKTYVPELTSLGLCHLFHSKVYNFRQEGWGSGALIFNIFPHTKYTKIKGAGGVENDFRLHMENAWHPLTPDGLILKGIRPDHNREAITYAVANGSILEALSKEDIEELKKPQFRISPPEVHRIMEKEKGIPFAANQDYLGPVLTQEHGGYCLRINFNGMKADVENSKASNALERLESVAKSLAEETRLNGDNLILLNNRRSIHTRNGFKARFDGNDRLFQRYYLLYPENLWRNLIIDETVFPFLNSSESKDLIKALTDQGILKNGILTDRFKPYDTDFVLPVPDAISQYKSLILKSLVLKGPSFPNRVV